MNPRSEPKEKSHIMSGNVLNYCSIFYYELAASPLGFSQIAKYIDIYSIFS